MYFTDAIRGGPFFRCMDQQIQLAKPIPADSDTPPPDNPNYEKLAKGKNLGQVQVNSHHSFINLQHRELRKSSLFIFPSPYFGGFIIGLLDMCKKIKKS